MHVPIYDLFLAKTHFWHVQNIPNFQVNIMTSYKYSWYLFWYQWKEETHSYTLEVLNIRI